MNRRTFVFNLRTFLLELLCLIVGWHHQLNGHEFEQTPQDSEEQGRKLGALQTMGWQRVIHYLATKPHLIFLNI